MTAHSDPRPVVLVLTNGDEPADVFDFAFAAARARHTTLVVVAAEPGPEDDATNVAAWEAGRQAMLDLSLASWQDKYPEVGVAVEIVAGELAASWLLGLSEQSQLLLVLRPELRPGA